MSRSHRPFGCEPLESRVLLSTFVWQNESDTDFETYFKEKAPLARAIVHRALADWSAVIADFNYADGSNTFTLRFRVQDTGSGERGYASLGSPDAEGKPHIGIVTLDNDGAGYQWYWDAVAADDAEFTTLKSPFCATGPFAGADFYRTVVHEIGHCLGIVTFDGFALRQYLTFSGKYDPNHSTNHDPDPVEGGLVGPPLMTFNADGGEPEATFTESHIYGGNFYKPDNTGLPYHPHDLMNEGLFHTVNPSTRQLISDIDAVVLRDAYGYTVRMPSTLNTFHANLNAGPAPGGGELVVNGGAGDANDQAIVDQDPATGWLRVRVANTTETFNPAAVNRIRVELGGGDDVLELRLPASNIPAGGVTLNGGAGTDELRYTGGLRGETAEARTDRLILSLASGPRTVLHTGTEAVAWVVSGGNDDVTNTAGTLTVTGDAAAWGVGSSLVVNGGTVNLHGAPWGTVGTGGTGSTGTGAAQLAVTVNAGGMLNLNSIQHTHVTHHLASLTVNDGGRADGVYYTGVYRVIKTKALSIAATGILNLWDSFLIVDWDAGTGNDPLGYVWAQIDRAHAAGWEATYGLTSSAANMTSLGLGVVDNASLAVPRTMFGGVPVDGTATLVRLTYYGDADLNGTVGFDDYQTLQVNFGVPVTNGWRRGDFNYDNVVDNADFNLLYANYGQFMFLPS